MDKILQLSPAYWHSVLLLPCVLYKRLHWGTKLECTFTPPGISTLLLVSGTDGHCYFAYKAGKRQFAHTQVGVLLVAPKLTQGEGSGAVTSRLFLRYWIAGFSRQNSASYLWSLNRKKRQCRVNWYGVGLTHDTAVSWGAWNWLFPPRACRKHRALLRKDPVLTDGNGCERDCSSPVRLWHESEKSEKGSKRVRPLKFMNDCQFCNRTVTSQQPSQCIPFQAFLETSST